jgi:hypothetical protein
MSTNGIGFSARLFYFPYNSLVSDPPPFLPPSKAIFTTSESIYRTILDPRIPVSTALIYTCLVASINEINRKRGNKPWKLSETGVFFYFVVIHNWILVLFSGWTFVGVSRVLLRSFPHLIGTQAVPIIVDSVCKLHGAPGLGNALFYNASISSWVEPTASLSSSYTSAPSGGSGRLWNEGVAMYGFLFYLSKFYEIVDTFIILAKGKRSSTLQIYHHAGIIICMWASVRYMAPPVWLLVLLNSGIHTIMVPSP